MDKEFLLKYLNTDSPSTYEVEAQNVWSEEVKKIGLLDAVPKSDMYGNTYVRVPNILKSDYRVVIDAHCDEISWIVNSITDEGFIKVKRNGGTYNHITPNTQVKVMTQNGDKIKGFFGAPPLHFHEEFKTDEHLLYVDIACASKDEVLDLGVNIGDYIVADRNAEILNNKYVVGKSLDDKIGGFILIEVLKKLKGHDIKLPYDLYVVNSVQEEIGLRGAKMVTDTIKPNVAIVFDACFDTNIPNIDKNKHGDFKLNDGLVFRKGYDVHPVLLKLMEKVATYKKYPYKLMVGGRGGTNTTSYNLSNAGVVTSTMSIPLRGMHTQNEMVSLDDIEKAIDMYVELLMNIEFQHDFRLVKHD